ncbi:MAG: AAA family ATPase [Burkholderiales bacterium]|nr:AAA family ATPase [Burkholderiales bacterium]
MRSTNFQSPFLERQQEIEALERHLAAACQSAARCVAISAEAGAGKSRLVEELRRRHPQGVQFLCGRAFSATANTPYAVWVDALDFHLRSLRRRDLLHVLGDSTDLRRLFSAVSDQFSLHAEALRPSEIGSEQTRLFGQMSALISRLASISPVVLALDNLQWADASSIEILHSVVRSVQGARVLIIGLYRAEETPAGGALSQCIASLQTLGLAETMALAPLSVAATAAIVAHGTGAPWPEVDVQQLHARTQGNALFIWEYLKHALVKDGGAPPRADAQRDALPGSIGSLIGERLRELDDDARRVLTIAAVIEAHIAYPLLRAVTGFDEERLLNALDVLTAQRFLNEVVNGADIVYEFHKPLVQATVYRTMGAARRQYLHRLIADELMRGGDSTDAAQVALHLVAGAAQDRQHEALPYLLRAADDAVSVFGNHEAVALLSSALRVATASPQAQVSLPQLYLNLGESYKRLGKFEQAVTAWRTALPLADDGERASLRRCMARALWQAGHEGAAITELQLGIDDPGSAAAGVAGALLRQEYAQSKARQGDVAGAMAEAARVLAQVDDEAQPELAARVHIVLCLAHGYRGEQRAAMQAGRKAVALSEALPYPGAAYLAHYTLAALLRYDGDLQTFEQHCEQCSRIASRMHAVALESWPLSIRIERYALLGRLREAIEIGERAIAIDRSIGQGTILPRSHAFVAVAYRMAGDSAAARRHLAQAEQMIDDFGKTEMRSFVAVGAAAAYVDFLDGRYLRALERIDALLAHTNRFEPLSFYSLHPQMLPLAAEAAARAGLADKAAALIGSIRSLQKGALRPAEAAVTHVGALLRLLRDEAAPACSELEQAIAHWEQARRPYDAARARVDLADALDALGRADDAAAELARAGAAFDAIGAARDVAMVSQRLRKRGLRLACTAPRRALGHPVSTREMEVVALVATGKTNKQIAAELFLSELTIETHVKNILRKLGLKSRAQIASHAAQLQAGAALTPPADESARAR